MKSEYDTQLSARRRFLQLRRAVQQLDDILECNKDVGEFVAGSTIADMRSLVEDINQCMHEFNAYWNVVNT